MMQPFELYCGDCLEVMPQLPGGCADAIIADLPYAQTQNGWDVLIPFEMMWEQSKRLLKPHGVIALFGSQPFTSVLVTSNPQWYRHEWIWQKSVGSNFLNTKREPMKEHESILIFSEGQWTYHQQRADRRDRERAKYAYRDSGKRAGYGAFAAGVRWTEDINTRCAGSVIYFAVERGLHPTQKPVGLLKYLVRTYSDKSETILDFCFGSGTTGVAALQTGRRFIGIERDADYFEIARRRIDAAAQQPLLLAV